LATSASKHVAPALCDAFKFQGVAGAIAFLAEVFVEFHTAFTAVTYGEYVEVAIVIDVGNRGQIVVLQLEVDKSGEAPCQKNVTFRQAFAGEKAEGLPFQRSTRKGLVNVHTNAENVASEDVRFAVTIEVAEQQPV